MKTSSTPPLLALCLVLLAGCSAPSPMTGSAFVMATPPPALATAISRVSATVSGEDSPPVSMELAISDGIWSGVLDGLPVGAQRSVHAQAFDASGALLAEGSSSGVSITSGQTVFVALELQQRAPLPGPDHAPPVIDSLVAASTSVTVGGALALTATAHDPNPDDPLSYAWSASAGTFSPATSASTTWRAPGTPGAQTLTLTVTDSQGLSTTATLTLQVTASDAPGDARVSISFNSAPRVSSLQVTVSPVRVGQTTSVSVSASDEEGDSLSYAWTASCAGTWEQASSPSARFTPSELPSGACDNCRLTVQVSDGHGGQGLGTVVLCVSPPPTSSAHFAPVLRYASASSGSARPGQTLTFEVVASDPERSPLTFSWAASTGTLGTADNRYFTDTSNSRMPWTAPSCVPAGAPPRVTATITNGPGLTAAHEFEVTGLPVCSG